MASPPCFQLQTLPPNSINDGKIEEKKSKELLEVEIISKGHIKPASPTPPLLRIYKFSILDQLNVHVYVPLVYFYPNDQTSNSNNLSEIISERRNLLKKSLSETLSHFYPFAGKIKDHLHIDCNDDGVFYIEARVNHNLFNFLSRPKNSLIHNLLPFHPSCDELISKKYIAMIQVNIFNCGGIAIGIYTSHKLVDGQTHLTFLKAWAANSSGFSQQIFPSLISPSLFLQNPNFPKDSSLFMWPSLKYQRKNVTRRLAFEGSNLVALKAKIGANPSRVMAVTGLIWKCVMSASKTRWGCQKPSILSLAVNLRERNFPPMTPYAIGNIYWSAIAQLESNSNLGLDFLIGRLRESVEPINSDFIEDFKGEEGSNIHVGLFLEEMRKIYSKNKETEYFAVTSWCNAGIYEADFGWGKPIWSCIGNPGLDIPMLTNLIFLMDDKSGDGIEAWITLDEQDMKIVEQDPELLAFASLDPSPCDTL